MHNTCKANEALLNDLVLENVFTNLSLSDLSTCRQVCTKWKILGNLILKKRWVFPLRFTTPPLKKVPQCIEDVDKVVNRNYPSFSLINFDKFYLTWKVKSHTIEFIADVVKKYSEKCSQLYLLEYSKYVYEPRTEPPPPPLPIFDMTPSLGQNLTVLCIVSNSYCVSISLNCIPFIQYLYLNNCNILLTDKMIKPKELLLSNVRFMNVDQVQNSVVLKSFVEFCNMKKLYLVNKLGPFPYIIDVENKNISLHTFHVISKEYDAKLHLCNLQWSVKNLSIDGFIDEDGLNINIRIKDLEVLHINSCLIIDSSWISQNIRKLSLKNAGISPDFENKCVFHNLKYLTLVRFEFDYFNETNDCITLLEHFSDSLQNVEYLKVGSKSEVRKLKSSLIPKKVKTLLLWKNVILICDDERLIDLDRLILCDYPWENIEILQYKFSADVLVISSEIENGDEGCEKLIELILHHSCTFKNIAVGKFDWQTKDFNENLKNFSIKPYVEEEANYYLFQNRLGKSLNETIFNDLCNRKMEVDLVQRIINRNFYLLMRVPNILNVQIT